MRRLFALLFLPRDTLRLIAAEPQWVRQFVFLSGVSILLAILDHPGLTQLTIDHLPKTASPQDKEAMKQIFDDSLPVKLAFLPVRLLLGWVSFTLVLFFTARSLTSHRTPRFVQLLSLEVHAEFILLIGQLASFLWIFIYPGEHVLRYLPGLLFFFPGIVNPDFRDVLNSFNPITAWYLIILAVGIRHLFDCKMWKSVIAVAGTWMLSVSFNFGIFHAIVTTFHFQM